jgi:hypothetical protein
MRSDAAGIAVALVTVAGIALMFSRPIWDRSVHAAHASGTSRPSASLSGPPKPSAMGARARARDGPDAAPVRVPAMPAKSSTSQDIEPAFRLAASLPHVVSVGDKVDLATPGPAALPVGITLAITYDPRLLRPRTAEEIDYSGDSIARGGFLQVAQDDGTLRVTATRNGGTRAGARAQRVGIVQFEAVARGTTTVGLSILPSAGTTGRRHETSSCDCMVSVN